jgi:hypothetical protein
VISVTDWLNFKDWDSAKWNKYMVNIARQIWNPDVWGLKGCFKVDVKTGETYSFLGEWEDFDTKDVDERPRIIYNPSDNFCGLL